MCNYLFEIWNFIWKMEYFDDEDYDMSWLTQVQSIESQKAYFEVLNEQDDSDGNLFVEIFGHDTGADSGGLVSLEENVTIRNGQILYDNVVAEDISSDEDVDQL